MAPSIPSAILIALLADTGAGFMSTPAQRPTAAQVVARLAQRIPDATPGVVYTADTDPNHILGRPGAYLSKAAFTDKRIASGDGSTGGNSVVLGGSVEVFADNRGAQWRKAYIQALAKGVAQVFEYDYVKGPVLVRVTKGLTPAQADEYKNALGKISVL